MKRQWRIHRHFRTAADGARRWDQVYQHLLEWAQPAIPGCGEKPVNWGWERGSFCALLRWWDATSQESEFRSDRGTSEHPI